MMSEPELKDGSMLANEAEFEKEYSRDWLAGNTSYQNVVEALSYSDSRLCSRDPKAVAQKIPWTDHGRVAILEMGSSGAFGPAVEFREVDKLRAYFASIYITNKEHWEENGIRTHGEDSELSPRRRLFIMENMGPGYVGVLGEFLGVHPSTFLDQERVIVMNTAAQGESDGMLLPSLSCPILTSTARTNKRHVTLKYFETLQFDRCLDNFRLVCGDTGRHIGVSRTDGQFTNVGVVRRKCTIWSKRTANGGWDCLVLCDRKVRRVRTGYEYGVTYEVKTQPYQGGYVGFVPEWEQKLEQGGPPRTSMLDDLVFYMQEHAASLVVHGAYATAPAVAMANPDIVVGTFVQKIVASHYLKLASNIRAVLSSAQRALSRKHDLASLSMEKVEELWSDIQASERRVGEYGEDLEAIMLKYGISLEKPTPASPAVLGTSYPSSTLSLSGSGSARHPRTLAVLKKSDTSNVLVAGNDTSSPLSISMDNTKQQIDAYEPAIDRQEKPCMEATPDDVDENANAKEEKAMKEAELRQWLDSTVDYQFLLLRFRELRHRTECLNSAVTGLASITGNRQAYREQQLALATARRSIREAKSSKAVTLLGLIFVPLAYTSSLFSMTQPFSPGGDKFWLYLATSAPLILIVIAAYTVLDAGYTDDGTSWSLAVFVQTSRSWFSAAAKQQATDIAGSTNPIT